jgi:acyl-CoA hydrolase
MKSEIFQTKRLVKGEDLNHHKTLFAGRCAEWFVEAGFIAVASVLPAHQIVCVQIHGLTFTKPVQSGDIACFKSRIINTGRSSLTVYVTLTILKETNPVVTGFITFVNLNEAGKAKPHGLLLELDAPELINLNKQFLEQK